MPNRRHSGLSSTLRERITDAIRQEIIKGTLPPDERLSEPELAQRYGISRTPIREALRQLESEGFIVVVPRKGARVAEISEQDVNEYYEVKALLEGYAARCAAPIISERELLRMQQLNDQMDRFQQTGDVRRIAKVHTEFHEAIVQAGGNHQLHQAMMWLANKFTRFNIQLASMGRRNSTAIAQHREIIEALRARDANRAEELVRANAMLGREYMIEEVRRDSRRLPRD